MLSEEEKQAIEYLKILRKYLGKDKQEMIDTGTYKFYEAFETNLDTVLNLITKLQEKNKEKDKKIKTLEHTNKTYKGMINKQNKQIDLMAEELTTPINSKEWVKEYYSKLAIEKGE